MHTTQEILEAIRKLPFDEQTTIRRLLAVDLPKPSDIESRLRKLERLCGSVDVGHFLRENPDREWIYGEGD